MQKQIKLSQEEIDAKFKLQFYLKDAELDQNMTEWQEWFSMNAPDTIFSFGSSSYSGHRFVTFLFDDKEVAATFRLFFGGKIIVSEP